MLRKAFAERRKQAMKAHGESMGFVLRGLQVGPRLPAVLRIDRAV
jgi:hypothetical protein